MKLRALQIVGLLVVATLATTSGLGATDCPAITIECVSENDCCGPALEFVVTIPPSHPSDKLAYKWRVSAGKIVSGQATRSIKVDASGAAGKNVTATVEIEGLAAECNNLWSSTQSICDPPPEARLFDRYYNLPFDKEKERLKHLAIALENEPGASAYLLFYDHNRERGNRARQHLISKYKIDPGRIVLVDAGRGRGSVLEIYIAPAGADPPKVIR